ncbi:hypothetical protein Syun_021674 [Stephania yunnanensis]|uniref:Uncharacterized protein n=1 Tax=Stephania yunnanensis TaxID=152371 RepID=A0AAP0NPC5_9MAGN
MNIVMIRGLLVKMKIDQGSVEIVKIKCLHLSIYIPKLVLYETRLLCILVNVLFTLSLSFNHKGDLGISVRGSLTVQVTRDLCKVHGRSEEDERRSSVRE